MARMKEIVTAAGALICALGIGFVMQSAETASQRYGVSQTKGTQSPMPSAASAQVANSGRPENEQVAVFDVQDVFLTSALTSVVDWPVDQIEDLEAGPVMAAGLEIPADPLGFPPEEDAETTDIPVAPPVCTISAAAAALPAAQAALSITAPCHAEQRVTIHHNGMFFTVQTDAEGATALTVPALAQNAVFIIAFTDGEGAVAQSLHDDISDYNRVILQWAGPAGFELHAREFGAEYGAPGHVWHGAESASSARLNSGTGGYLTRLGLDGLPAPHVAEVYTFPAAMSGRNGQVDLSVEAEITAENCGLEIEAQTLERGSSGRMRTQNLTLAVPGCDAIGDYLVLNNVLDDMKVAAR